MRRREALAGLAGLAAGAVATGAVAPASASTAGLVLAHRFGVLRFTGGRWQIIADDAHLPLGLTSVAARSDGRLVVGMLPLTRIGSFHVTGDETYAGRFCFGASVGFNSVTITITNATGSFVPCTSAALALRYANLQLTVWGWEGS